MQPDFKDTIKLLRIPFSFFLLPLFLFAASQSGTVVISSALWSFFIIHFLVYPASNGYNSYVDRDEGSIGGLEKPPLPTMQLFYITVALDITSIFLSFIAVNTPFAVCIALYILASRAYSARAIRLKKYPVIGFLVVIFFQGAFTYYMALIGIGDSLPVLRPSTLWILAGCSFQIAGAYPLTQVYQHEADLKDGVVTISYLLGYRGTFAFTAIMFFFCNVFYYLYFQSTGQGMIFYILQSFFLPIIVYFVYWYLQVNKSTTNANFKNTMRMNKIAAVCMNSCFLVLIIISHFL